MVALTNAPFFGLRDPVSSATHFLACLWAVYATGILWRLSRGERYKQWALGCFGCSAIVLYCASATYHALRLPPVQLNVFRLIDHSAIYLLIAGSWTPVCAVLLRNRLFLAGIWGIASIGIAAKWIVPDAPHWLTILLYIGTGWVGIPLIITMIRTVGMRGFQWALYGGIWYTLGGLADLFRWPQPFPGLFGSHEVLHVCVMAGTFCHFVFMLCYVIPFTRSASCAAPAVAATTVTQTLPFASVSSD